jgi:hypothetical protein
MRERLPDIVIDACTSRSKELAAYLSTRMDKMRAAVRMSGARPDG